MSTKYLLPCTCGVETIIDQRQAGELVTCTCGRALEVPTLRGLANLEAAESPAEQRSTWGPKQGLAFIGILLTVAALGFAAYAYVTRPKPDLSYVRRAMDISTPASSLAAWEVVRRGVDVGPTPMSVNFDRRLASSWRWIYVSLGSAALGVLIVVSSLLVETPRH